MPIRLLLACLAVLVWTPVGFAQQGVMLGDSLAVEAEDVGIDKVDRTLTLRGQVGNVVLWKSAMGPAISIR